MKDLDGTLDYMENSRFNYIYGTAVMHMHNPIFSEIELLCISMIYHKFTIQDGRDTRYMQSTQLRKCLLKMFRISDKRITNRIIRTICIDRDCKDPHFSPIHHCTLNSFIRLFTIYYSKDLDLRMQFVFSVYDEDSVGQLSRELVIKYIAAMFEGDDDDEVFELRADMLEICFRKFDMDKDLNISYDEYVTVVRKQPYMIEFLGIVFPSEVQLNVVAHCANLFISEK